MDFLKSCTTNVHVVESLTAISCASFALDAGANEAENRTQLYRTIGKLRQGKILCTLDGERLLVFGYKLDATKAALRELRYAEGAVEEETKPRWLSDAIEATLAYKLAAEGLTHVAPWTWIFVDDENERVSGGGGTLIRLHARIGGNGALFVSSTIRSASLMPFPTKAADENDHVNCLLAPSGIIAKVRISPGTADKPVVGNAMWKASIAEFLQAEGVALAEDEFWIEVEVSHEEDSSLLLWPRRMCFPFSDTHDAGATLVDDYWKKWFGPSIAQDEMFHDPLVAAEEWFTGATQRVEVVPSDEPATKDTNAPRHAISDLVTSPPFNQRTADQQAAMGGIYPTPPDGLLPGTQGTQQQPSSESNTMPPIEESSELLPGEEMEGLRQSISSSNAPDAAGLRQSDDDLFGDMGEMGMDFGDGVNEVGDADFDYFDEPDEEPDDAQQADEAVGDVDMADAGTAHEPGEAEDHALQASVIADEMIDSVDARNDTVQHPETSKEQSATDDLVENYLTTIEKDEDADTQKPTKPDRPLSPFGIRERLLPPPIPASTVRAENEKGGSARRASAYAPLTFKEGLGLAPKYNSDKLPNQVPVSRPTQRPNGSVGIAPGAKRLRVRAEDGDADSDGSDDVSKSSGESSYDSDTSVSEMEALHHMPWETRKRKRAVAVADDEQSLPWLTSLVPHGSERDEVSEEKVESLRRVLLRSDDIDRGKDGGRRIVDMARHRLDKQSKSEDDDVPPIDQLYNELDDLDLVYIAQLIAEQCVSVVPRIVDGVKNNTAAATPIDEGISSAVTPLFEKALSSVLPATTACDMAKLTLARETPRPTPSTTVSNSGKGPHPVQRANSMQQQQQGPDYYPIPAPYVRVQRYGDAVELLPPALRFWSTLGLSPASGAKDVRVVSLVPGNLDLVHLMREFVAELGLVYEANKFGSWKGVTGLHAGDDADELALNPGDSSMILVQPHVAPEDPIVDAVEIMQSYALSCENLGRALATVGHEDADRTIVVCIVNPFRSVRAQQALCACFWLLYKSYRDQPMPKGNVRASRSDIVLRILPVDLLAASGYDGLIILEQAQYAQLAMEIYHRCPPSTSKTSNASAKDVPPSLTPFIAAPAIELALPLPRRIPFQLAPEPPADLLHENSVLHLAYAVSRDKEWMCFAWMDGSGRFAGNLSVGLRGRSGRLAVEEAWERIVGVGGEGWGGRVFVTGVTGDEKGGAEDGEWEKSIRDYWRAVIARRPARRTMLHVSFLSVDLDPELRLTPPLPSTTNTQLEKGSMGQGFLTPITTPSGTALTVSPDASASSAAPPTPAPSDPSGSGESEAEAQLVELADESWGVILSPAYTSSSTSSSSYQPALATGTLLRRGSPAASALESLTVHLHWDIRVRPTGAIDEGPARHAEFSLREVLKAFRGLGVLARARGLGEGAVPVHVGSVVRAREGLVGLVG